MEINRDFPLDVIADPELKRTVLGDDYSLKFFNNQYRSGVSSLLPLKERIYVTSYGQAFPLFSPFYESFNEKIQRLFDSGLTDLWIENTINPRGVVIKVDEIGPQVLTLDHLEIAFKIILISVGISVIGFFAEIVFFQIHRAWTKWQREKLRKRKSNRSRIKRKKKTQRRIM